MIFFLFISYFIKIINYLSFFKLLRLFLQSISHLHLLFLLFYGGLLGNLFWIEDLSWVSLLNMLSGRKVLHLVLFMFTSFYLNKSMSTYGWKNFIKIVFLKNIGCIFQRLNSCDSIIAILFIDQWFNRLSNQFHASLRAKNLLKLTKTGNSGLSNCSIMIFGICLHNFVHKCFVLYRVNSSE